MDYLGLVAIVALLAFPLWRMQREVNDLERRLDLLEQQHDAALALLEVDES